MIHEAICDIHLVSISWNFFLCEVWSTFVLEKQIMEKDPCNDTVCCNTSVALWLFTHIIKSNRFVFLVCISNLKLVRFDPVYLLTDAGTNTLIPHVVVYRPCFHIQRLASNIYFWTHVVFTRHMCRQSGLFMSYTVWFFYIYIKKIAIAYDKFCNAFCTYIL